MLQIYNKEGILMGGPSGWPLPPFQPKAEEAKPEAETPLGNAIKQVSRPQRPQCGDGQWEASPIFEDEDACFGNESNEA